MVLLWLQTLSASVSALNNSINVRLGLFPYIYFVSIVFLKAYVNLVKVHILHNFYIILLVSIYPSIRLLSSPHITTPFVRLEQKRISVYAPQRSHTVLKAIFNQFNYFNIFRYIYANFGFSFGFSFIKMLSLWVRFSVLICFK